MTAYYVTILLVFLFSYFATQVSLKKSRISDINKDEGSSINIWLIAAAAVLIYVAGFRYFVGTDYRAYYYGYDSYASNLWTSIKELDEPGMPILASIINLFTDEGIWFIFASSVITIGLITYTTYKNVNTYIFSSLLIIFTGIWHGTFNGIRQYIAAAIVFFGYRYILEKKFWKYALVVFIAFLFHSSALFMIIPYFVLNNKISLKNIFFLCVGTLIFLANYDVIFSLIGFMKESEFDTTNAYAIHHVNRLRVLVEAVPAVACLFLYRNSEKDKEATFYINALILNAIVSIATMNSALLTRFNLYTGLFLPLALGKLIVLKDKKTELVLKIFIVGLYCMFWYHEISISHDLSNFDFFW